MDEIKPELVDALLQGYQKPEDIVGENGLLKRLTKALLERAMSAELTNHLGYEKHARRASAAAPAVNCSIIS